MITPDSIDPIPFLIVMALIVAVWLWLGIRDRRRARVDRLQLARLDHAVYRVEVCLALGGCAYLWRDPHTDSYHVCNRSRGHAAPHLGCSIE